MMMNRKCLVISAIALCVCACSPTLVLADLSLVFSDDGTNFKSDYEVGLNQEITIGVYIQEQGTTDLTDYGLAGVGVRGDFTPKGPDRLGEVTASNRNPVFDFAKPGSNAFDNAAGWLTMSGGLLLNIDNPPKGNPILVGEFTFKGTAVGDKPTSFTFGDLNPGGFSNFSLADDDFTDIDPILFGANGDITYGMSITTVPEPSTWALLVTGSFVFLPVLRRRRKRSA